jgi:diguanylate cyclase (GGDEF)-like protein
LERRAVVNNPSEQCAPDFAPAAAGAAPLGAEDIAAIFAAMGEAAYAWDAASDRLVWSANAPDVVGVGSLDEISTGRLFAALLDPENPLNRYDAVFGSAGRDDGEGVPYELRYSLSRAGQAGPCWVEDCGRWYAGKAGNPARAAGVVRIVTERHRSEQQLLHSSAIDSLTGSMNRSRLVQAMEELLTRGSHKQTSFGFLLIGIDDLGRVNRSYGFDLADQVIGMVAQRLCSVMRTSDALGRFSGNKFGVILHECDEEALAVAAARFVNAVREAPLETAVGPVAISVTAGGVIAPRHARTVPEIMGRAQEALDLAQGAARGTFRAYAPSIESEARRRENLRQTDVIVSALNDRRVSMAFQPVVNAKTRELAFRECLVRLFDHDGTEIDAMSIVPVAEKLDLVRMIDHRVLELAAGELREDSTMRCSLNVSASTVHDPVWLAAFGAETRGGVGERLIVEITESAAIRDVEATRRFVAHVKGAGCKVAIDDFGAGYSSFRNLRRLGVDMVKIDGSFVANLEYAPDDRAFVRALLELAHELGLETVAEWVQSEEAAAWLIEWGCDYFQGALVGLAATKPNVQTVIKEGVMRTTA